jgi:ribosomal protein L37E
MGIFSDNKWECNRCGKKHRSNPEECSNCGHTVLQQYQPNQDQPDRTPTVTTSPSSSTSTKSGMWVCMKCKQDYDEERETCAVCGTEDVQFFEGESNDGSKIYDDDYDGPMISNASEITDMPDSPSETSTDRSKSSLWVWLVALFLLASGLWISIQFIL